MVKNDYFIMVLRLIHSEYIRMLNTNTSKNRASKYMKQNLIELQGEIDPQLYLKI